MLCAHRDSVADLVLFNAFYSVMDVVICFFKQKTAYEMRISDWSSDVCSSDLLRGSVGEDRVGGLAGGVVEEVHTTNLDRTGVRTQGVNCDLWKTISAGQQGFSSQPRSTAKSPSMICMSKEIGRAHV